MKKRNAYSMQAAILVAGLVGACASAEELSQVPKDSPSPVVTAVPTREPSPIPSPEKVKKSAIPDVTGTQLQKARSMLENIGFFIIVRKKNSE
jgi:hypothetical protein